MLHYTHPHTRPRKISQKHSTRRYTHDNTHVAPTLHPHYTHVAPVDISVCPQNVCKIVCVAGMYVIFYVVQLTVLLLNSVHPSYTRLTPAGVEHPHLHPRDFADTGITHTYTRGFP